MSDRLRALGTRWLGLGLASVIAVVTLGLGITGRLTLYISPDSVWYVCVGAVVVLAGAVWSFALPLGDELEHGHDHGGSDAGDEHRRRSGAAVAAAVSAGAVASVVVVAALVLPPASLSVGLAMSRTDAGGTLFAGADTPTLGVADTSTFGIGEWSSVFTSATRPEAYDGTDVTLTGFVTPGEDGTIDLTRMIITHCVIDAQPAAVRVGADPGDFSDGQWVEVTGTVTADADGALSVVPSEVTPIDEPKDPYEY